MQEQLRSVTTLEHDDGVGNATDAFRRATFHWAQSTKRMVESSNALSLNAKVAFAALADIEYARDMLDKLFVPAASKVPAGVSDHNSTITAKAVQESVSKLATRVATLPCCDHGAANSRLQAHVDEIVGAPPIVRSGQVQVMREGQWKWEDPPKPWPAPHRGADLSAPVQPRNGKMLWAGVDCPACPSKASQRCQKDDGGFVEKPHKERKTLAEQA